MRYWLAMTAVCVLCACSDKPQQSTPDAGSPTDAGPVLDSGTASTLDRPGALECPPTGPGLPADLKPPGH